MTHPAVFPFAVFAVMVALPYFLALTRPFLSTVATEVSLLVQVTVLSVAVSGLTVAVKETVRRHKERQEDLAMFA